MKSQKVLSIFFFFLIFFKSLSYAETTTPDSMLLGTWGFNGQPMYTFSSGGKGESGGEAFQWTTNQGILKFIEYDQTEEVSYKIEGDQLTLTINGMYMVLQRIGSNLSGSSSEGGLAKKSVQKETPSTDAASSPKAPKKNDDSTALNQLLLSSAWCSFSYNKVSGATNTRRVQFSNNGVWSDNSRHEGYSSGYGGTMASQNDGSGLGQWKVEKGILYMSGPNFALTQVNLQINQNSNGYPIILADGIEYSQCQ